jgi:hypothetical protein
LRRAATTASGALQPGADGPHGLVEPGTGGHGTAEQVGDHLGVGLGHQGHTLGLELGAQQHVVLDDPVVDQRHPAVGADVRVGVDVVGRAVGGPAGVAEAHAVARHRVVAQGLLEVGQLARLLGQVQPPVGHHGHTGGVVAAVLQAPEAVHDHLHGGLRTYVADDSTHGPNPTGRRPADLRA